MTPQDTDEIVTEITRIFDAAKYAALAIVLERRQEKVRQQPAPESLCITDGEAEKIDTQLQRIKAKEFLTVNEVALLLSCSPSHVRNLVKKAQQRKSKRPIPFRDLDGVTVFHRLELLEWSERSKPLSPASESCLPDADSDRLSPASLAAVHTERRGKQ